MAIIETLRPADWTTALNIALAKVPAEDRPAHVAHCANLLAAGTLDPGAIRIARGDGGAIVGVQICVPMPGASCLFWLPSAPDDLADMLLQDCLAMCRARGVKIAQAFLNDEEFPLASPLLRQGFQAITRMHQLEYVSMELPPVASSLRFATLPTVGYRDFAAALERTYQGTLDCPELNGKRSIDDIIAGHRAEGKYDPTRWFLACQGDQPVGVALLMELRDGLTWDLSYLGIVPEHRRRGHGRAILRHALRFALEQCMTRLILAVDGRNLPALRLYQAEGFREFDRCEVLLKFLEEKE